MIETIVNIQCYLLQKLLFSPKNLEIFRIQATKILRIILKRFFEFPPCSCIMNFLTLHLSFFVYPIWLTKIIFLSFFFINWVKLGSMVWFWHFFTSAGMQTHKSWPSNCEPNLIIRKWTIIKRHLWNGNMPWNFFCCVVWLHWGI